MLSIHLTPESIDYWYRVPQVWKLETRVEGIDDVGSSAWRWPEFAIDSLILRLVVLHEGALVYRSLIRLCMIEFWLDIDTYDLATSWIDRISIINHFAYSIPGINRSIAISTVPGFLYLIVSCSTWAIKHKNSII